MADGLRIAGVRLVVEGADKMQSELKKSNQSLQTYRAEQRKLDAQYGKNSKNVEYLSSKQRLLNDQLDTQRKRTQTMREALDAYNKTADANPEKMHKMSLALKKSEELEAGFERQLRETGNEIKAFGFKADAAKAKLLSFASAADKISSKLSNAGSKLTTQLTLPLLAGFSYAAKEFIDFDKAYKGVIKTVDADEATLKRLREDIVALSGANIVTQSKEQIAEVASNAGQLGIHVENILGFSKAMLQLADSTNLTATDAAQGLAKFANVVGLDQKEFSNLGSAIVALGNNSATMEDQILAMGMRIASAGKQARMSVADIMGVAAALSSVGIEAEMGGTAFSKTLTNIDIAVAKGEQASKKYANIAGMSAKAYRELWRENSAQAFVKLIEGLQKISKEGGNVAIALESIGIKETRVRDTITRAVSSGELLTGAIELSNKAYKENTALAKEAALKNESYAARIAMLKNRFDNASMALGEGLMPVLEKGMGHVDKLINSFVKLDDKQKINIINLGLTAMAIGPVTKGLGGLIGAIGKTARAISFLKSSPLGLVGVGVGAVALLAYHISTLKGPMERLKESMKDMRFDINEETLERFKRGIDKGLEAVQKEQSVHVTVRAEMDSMDIKFSDAFKDGKLSWRERKELKEQLNGLVKTEIDSARKDLEASVKEYADTLNRLKDVDGKDLFSEEEKAELISGVKNKTNSLVEQLEEYKSAYNSLLDAIYKNKGTATEQQMADLEALLVKIGKVREEIRLAKDEAVQSARAQYKLTIEGRGDERTAGVALGYVDSKRDIRLEDIKKERDSALSKIESSELDYETKLERTQKIVAEYNRQIKKTNKEYVKEIQSIIEGVAKGNAGISDELGKAVEAIEKLKRVKALMQSDADPDVLARFLADEGVENWLPDISEDNDSIKQYLEKLEGVLVQEVESAMVDLGDKHPLIALLRAMQEQKVEIDPKYAEGITADLFRILDFANRGAEFGLDFSEGIGAGMESPEAKKEVDGAAAMINGVLGSAGNGFYRTGEVAGKGFVDGVIASINHYSVQVKSAMGGLVSGSQINTRGLVFRPKLPDGKGIGLGLAGNRAAVDRMVYGSVVSGYSSTTNNIDQGAKIHVANLNVRRESDIHAIGRELSAINRQQRQARGS